MRDFRNEIAAEYQDLFDFMKREHGLTLTEQQMDEIIYAVRRFEDSYDDKLGKEIAEMSDKEFDSNCKKLEDSNEFEKVICPYCKRKSWFKKVELLPEQGTEIKVCPHCTACMNGL